jgi:glycosyltransferase involved in cell wall biosynthesis
VKNKISICLATYNGEKYLKEQFDSLVNQTISPYEVILQDDCSTDGTVEIARQYMDKLNLKIYLNEINLGFTKNFESVLQKATGDLIAPCDQDDIWKSDKLEILLSNLGKNSLVYSNSLLVNCNGESLGERLSTRLGNVFMDSKSPLNFIFANSISAHAMLFKKELLQYLFPFPKNIFFDAWIGAVASSLNGVKYIDQDLVYYRQHDTNTLSNKKKIKRNILEKVIEKTKKKKISNDSLIIVIEEFLQIKTLSDKDKTMLLYLKQCALKFEKTWFNLRMFLFLFKNKNIFFVITTKNKFILCFKKSIGYKLYKAAPFL